jgi:hypothetical protein
MSFEELARNAGDANIFFDPSARPLYDDKAGYDTPDKLARAKEEASRSVWAAAFRTDNSTVSLFSREDAGLDNKDDGKYDPVEYVRTHNMQGYEDAFLGVLNTRRADAIRAQITREEQDKQTLEAAGWPGTFARIAAGAIDLPSLIPGGAVVRGARGGYLTLKSALLTGAAAGLGAGVQEAALQSSQFTRTSGESYVNIGAAVVIGSLLGGGASALLSRAERKGVEGALANVTDIQAGVKPNEHLSSGVGADVADGAFFVDPIDVKRTTAELAVEGKAANVAVKATSDFNPVLRATQRYAASARQVAGNVYENTIYRAMHSAGDTTGVSAEAAVRTRVASWLAEAGTQSRLAYKEMRGSGVRMSETDFNNAVGVAMRNLDQSDNPFVARAAQAYRKMFDDFTNDAIKLGLLKETDLDVKTAASYFSRVYNRDRLLASEGEFLDVIGKHYADRMAASYVEDAAVVTAKRALHRTRTEDIQLSGEARSGRITEIKAEGDKLDTQHSHLNDLIDDLSSAKSRVRSSTGEARATAQQEVKSILTRGGDELKAYLGKRGELRSRLKNLTERNPDAMAAKAEQIQERIADLHDTVYSSLSSFARRAKNALKKLDSDPVANAEVVVKVVEEQAARVQAVLERSQERLAKMIAEGADPAALNKEAELLAKREQAMVDIVERLKDRDLGVDEAVRLTIKLDALLDDVTKATAARTLKRGERLKVLKDRAAKLTPEEVTARFSEQKGKFDKNLELFENRFDAKWGPRRAMGIEKGEAYDFEAAGKSAAKEIYDKISGKVQHREDLPSFVTKITSGPLKERTFMVPDELLSTHGWLHNDVREVANRYARSVAGEVELTRRFGRADMADQLKEVADEYSGLREKVFKAKTPEQVNEALGRDKFKPGADVVAAKTEAQRLLSLDEASAIEDIKAGRDMIRGTYNAGVNNSNWGTISRSLMHFNYVRQMGGVLLSNLTDFYRPAMVHGLKDYLSFMPKVMPQAFNAGSDGVKLSIMEAKKAGLIVERVTHMLMQQNGDVADPFLSRTSQVERFMQKATNVASRWNLVNVFTDAQQSIASIMSQHRIMSAVLEDTGDGSFVGGDGQRLLRMLGIDARTQGDIRALLSVHGKEVDGVRVANTEQWLAGALESGSPEAIARAENAVRTYRAALNTDVNSIVSRRGMGDAPLIANTPAGKLITQFSGYAMGAHSRVMIRGLQESHARLVGGLTAMTMLGAMTSYLAAWRGGKERWDRYVSDTTKNPALLIGEGLDRSGFFPLLFDVSNRVERVSGAVGYDYRFNPIKSPIAVAGGGRPFGIASTRGSDSSAAFGAVFGPTAGLLDSAVAAGRVIGDKAQGKKPPKRDENQALAAIPYSSYYGMRELLQVLHGNSNYTRE